MKIKSSHCQLLCQSTKHTSTEHARSAWNTHVSDVLLERRVRAHSHQTNSYHTTFPTNHTKLYSQEKSVKIWSPDFPIGFPGNQYFHQYHYFNQY